MGVAAYTARPYRLENPTTRKVSLAEQVCDAVPALFGTGNGP